MASFTCPFRIQRIALSPGVLTPITPPMICSSVTVANRTGADIEIHSDNSGTDYGIVSDGFEERFDLSQSGAATAVYRPGQINFYVKSTPGGTIVVSWS
jgi:hypothetical protein